MDQTENKFQSPKSIISKSHIKHSSTYTSNNVSGLSKIKKKKVVFVDRVESVPLFTIYNYEQVDIIEEEFSPKSSSCACTLF